MGMAIIVIHQEAGLGVGTIVVVNVLVLGWWWLLLSLGNAEAGRLLSLLEWGLLLGGGGISGLLC